ncbi:MULTISPECIES: dipeptidase PepV [unclassified Facklamia]|uniref:dipeptidase PepV n=1 Tax=Aerococcaceae TaxID=186827 RepID=UPI0013BC5E5B|nr:MULTISPECIES: dipeptidase PepV [unclassified Facklamia]NEW64844.1 dipeptidase PepV [Facklamia sp. 252]NEW68166.1 dipeptidase PepV [Facklamia sp. 253]QQD66013.1 dipeptidase PepV [Aerococcaceae bacterium zg-252]
MVNWLAEVEQRKEQLFSDLFRLLRVPSVREDDKATAEAPVGPGPKAALEEFMKMAQEDGFETKQFGPWAGRIEVGSGEQLLGILGHVDVVPVGTGWETDPFEPVIKDNRIYARGSSDDKGPTVAAYFAIKLLRELGYEFNQRVHLIVGTDEESGWQCMDYYFQHAEMPDFGFSPDAVFPIINGEKGNVSFTLSLAPKAQAGEQQLVSFEGGLRENMVIQDVTATVKGLNPSIAALYADFLNEHDLKGNVELNGDEGVFTLVGKAAHGSTPEKGRNAATYLARFLVEFAFDNHAADDFITLLATELHEDFIAEKVGVAHHHEVMGNVSMNVGIVSYDAEKGGSIILNFRFPEGTTPETMGERFAKKLSHYDFDLAVGESKEPHYVPANDPLVSTLLDVYESQTGLEGHEMTIGGGTYGRLMPRGVAFGALFPDSIDTMHQANEFLAIDDLLRATAIYAEAIYRLTR